MPKQSDSRNKCIFVARGIATLVCFDIDFVFLCSFRTTPKPTHAPSSALPMLGTCKVLRQAARQRLPQAKVALALLRQTM